MTRHADVSNIIRQHDLFHCGDRPHTLVPKASDEMARALTGGSPHPIRTLVHMDEPDHLKYRRITQSWFTQQKVGSLEHRIRAVARASIDRMAEHGSACDFVRDVAIHYPLHVLMQILGVPEQDEPRMLKLTQELFASEDADLGHGEAESGDPTRHAKELFRLLGEFQAYFVPLISSPPPHSIFLGGFRTPAAEPAAPSLKRPASETFTKAAMLDQVKDFCLTPKSRHLCLYDYAA